MQQITARVAGHFRSPPIPLKISRRGSRYFYYTEGEWDPLDICRGRSANVVGLEEISARFILRRPLVYLTLSNSQASRY